jgi:hypothetical protein
MTMNLFTLVIATASFVGVVAGCGSSTTSPDDIGNTTDIELTKPGNQWSASIRIGDSFLSAPTTVRSEKRVDGITTLSFTIDLTGHRDSALVMQFVPEKYLDSQGRISSSIQVKATKDGIQDFTQSGKPWTLVRYDAKVGDAYTVTDENGLEKKRTVVERTDKDDWSFGFFLIKTIKVEEVLPEDDQVASKIWYRANHRFGLVYMETFLRAGGSIRLSLTTLADV